jgi:hypothetical protein
MILWNLWLMSTFFGGHQSRRQDSNTRDDGRWLEVPLLNELLEPVKVGLKAMWRLSAIMRSQKQ